MPENTWATSVSATPGSTKPDPILIANDVQRNFGGLRAVDVKHLEVQRNSITSLIGPNGAGKTTFFNLLTGFDRPDAGNWQLDGGPLVGLPAYRVARRGMVRTFQLSRVMPLLSVTENIMLAAPKHPGESVFGSVFGGWRKREREAAEFADHLLERFNLTHMRDEYAGTLSGGQRKLLELARAMMLGPELIMLDEPMAGINPALTQTLLHHIVHLKDDGKTVIFVEHDMDVVREISDWVVVMAEGWVIAEDRPDDIAGNREVIDAYLGTHHGEAAS